jgi:NADPH-dependent curcumin reductase CurA
MTNQQNQQIRLARRPEAGLPGADTWELHTEAIDDPDDGEVAVAVEYLSLDPAMRGWLNDVRSYTPPVAVGEVMRASGVGRVTQSRHPAYTVGDHVFGLFGVQEHATLPGSELRLIDTTVAPGPTWLGLLGLPGLTAYFGLFEVARAQPGEVVAVSAAAGAVGSVAAQLAAAHGCQVIAIAGGPTKCSWLTDVLGVTATIDYKNQQVGRALRELAPNGIDVYFDNVGGEILDDALARLRLNARVVICGATSQYNATAPLHAPRNYLSLLINRASMTGMLVNDFADRFDAARAELTTWLKQGRIVSREHILTGGVPRFPEALQLLFAGANTGKFVLQVDA